MIDFHQFLSVGHYVFVPSKKNAKVILNIIDKDISANSLKLYNPFSKNGKIFKFILKLIVVYCNTPLKWFFGCRYNQSSKFILEIERRLNIKIYASSYYATAKDKVVLQLQSKNNGIIGYLKYSLNDLGKSHIASEVQGINILINADVLASDYLLLDGLYNGFNYCILKNINGKIIDVPDLVVKDTLRVLERGFDYALFEHPRVLQLQEQLKKKNLLVLYTILTNYASSSKMRYKLVYEHGDFAEWNLIKVGANYVFFDFEYFVSEGLEYLDLIKFHFHKASLLKKIKNLELIHYLEIKTSLGARFNEVFIVFLIKEIIVKTIEFQDCSINYSLLKLILKKENDKNTYNYSICL
jgi:hypothetical protein